MSCVHRLKVSDRMFLVTVNLRQSLARFTEAEYALIWPRHPLTVSRVVSEVKSEAAKRVNRLRERKGALWQHQFWDRFVRHKREYGERLNYMHDNPVRKGFVKKPEDWRWSSFRNFSLSAAERAASPIQIDYVELPESYRG